MDITLMLRAAHRHALPTPIPRDGACKFCQAQALAQEGGGPGQGQGAVAGAVQPTAPLSRLLSESASLQGFASGCQHAESGAAYLQWPSLRRESNGCAEERAAYFNGLLRDAGTDGNLTIYVPKRQQATTILDLMTVRAFHSKALRRHSLGSALGFRIRGGMLTTTPAIIVFVARKVHMQWLLEVQKLPSLLEGPGGVWCDVDVLEFSHYTAPAGSQKEQVHSDLVEGLRGNDPCIGSGSQVASQETYGTIGAVVRSQTGDRQLGFLTNRHVAVDLDYPNQKMFHPLPPNLGPGVFLGAVERATSFISDDLWYGIFAGMNPESFVRADGAFIPFAESFDLTNVSTSIKGVGEIGDVMNIDLQDSIDNVVGKHVVKVGRSSGLTKGVIMAYAVENNDENGICFFTDLLIVGKDRQSFDLEGDSGSLVILCPKETHDKPRPIGIIWGGTANRGRLKLGSGYGPVNWTSGVDIGRLLKLLQLNLVTSVPGQGGDAGDPDPEFERLEAGKNSVGGEKQAKPERREGTSELHGKQVATADSSAKPVGGAEGAQAHAEHSSAGRPLQSFPEFGRNAASGPREGKRRRSSTE